jgi:hypothetical protein
MASIPRITIKSFANDYFTRVSFVDIHGRNIGYDYDHILNEIKIKFPKARTSRHWLQKMAYTLNREMRLPVRRRSRVALAEEYAKTLLLRRTDADVYSKVAYLVHKKFPDQRVPPSRLRSLEVGLCNHGFPIPPRPE